MSQRSDGDIEIYDSMALYSLSPAYITSLNEWMDVASRLASTNYSLEVSSLRFQWAKVL